MYVCICVVYVCVNKNSICSGICNIISDSSVSENGNQKESKMTGTNYMKYYFDKMYVDMYDFNPHLIANRFNHNMNLFKVIAVSLRPKNLQC